MQSRELLLNDEPTANLGGMLGSGDAVTLIVRMQDDVWRLDFETVQDGQATG